MLDQLGGGALFFFFPTGRPAQKPSRLDDNGLYAFDQ
jgi:hypothetical protein